MCVCVLLCTMHLIACYNIIYKVLPCIMHCWHGSVIYISIIWLYTWCYFIIVMLSLRPGWLLQKQKIKGFSLHQLWCGKLTTYCISGCHFYVLCCYKINGLVLQLGTSVLACGVQCIYTLLRTEKLVCLCKVFSMNLQLCTMILNLTPSTLP